MTLNDPHINRLTSYITFFPKSLRTEEIKQLRIQGYMNAENCSHYAFLHKKKPPTYNTTSHFNVIKPELIDNNIPDDRLQYI